MAKKRKILTMILKIFGYFIFFLAMTLLFVYLTLPFERIKERVVQMLEQKTGARIKGELDFVPIAGVKGYDLSIKFPKKGPTLLIPRLRASLSVLPLLAGKLQVEFEGEILGGKIDKGKFVKKGRLFDVEASWKGLNLGLLIPKIKMFKGKTLSPTLNGEVKLSFSGGAADPKGPARFRGPLTTMKGPLKLEIDEMTIPTFKIPIKQWGNQPFTIPKIKMPKIKGLLMMDQGYATIKTFKTQGKGDVEVELAGYLTLRERWQQMRVDMHVKFKFSKDFLAKNKKLTVLDSLGDFKKAKDPKGFYGFCVRGSIHAFGRSNPFRLYGPIQACPRARFPLTPPKGLRRASQAYRRRNKNWKRPDWKRKKWNRKGPRGRTRGK